MEIKLKIKISDILNKIPDETKDFLKRILIFSVVVKYGFIYVADIFFTIMFLTEELLRYSICNAILQQGIEFGQGIFDDYSKITQWAIFHSLFPMYYTAKICGIFKKLERYNFFVSLIIIIFLCFLLISFGRIGFLTDKILHEIWVEYYYVMYTLIPAFFLNRLFIFLGKKYKLCRKIGYYFSFEFYRELFLKIKNRKDKNKNQSEDKNEHESQSEDKNQTENI